MMLMMTASPVEVDWECVCRMHVRHAAWRFERMPLWRFGCGVVCQAMHRQHHPPLIASQLGLQTEQHSTSVAVTLVDSDAALAALHCEAAMALLGSVMPYWRLGHCVLCWWLF